MKTKQTRKPIVRFTLAARLLATGQRLRADEAVVPTTFALTFAAKSTRRAAEAR